MELLPVEPLFNPQSTNELWERISYGGMLLQPKYKKKGLGPPPNDVKDLGGPRGGHHYPWGVGEGEVIWGSQ